MGLYKRQGVYYGRVKDNRGRWVSKTLNTDDRTVAKERYRELERREAVPAYRAAHETSLSTAADEFLASRDVKGCAAGTLHMYGVKLRHIKRLLRADSPLESIDAPTVDRYTATRLREGASRNTIHKEHVTLRGLLKVAKRAGKYPHDIDAVMPIEWVNDYEPRRTALEPAQVWALAAVLAAPRTWKDKRGRVYERDPGPNKSAFVAFTVATGARLGEAMRATRGQIDMERGFVYFAITKTRRKGKREKYVPITPLTRPLLEFVLEATPDREYGVPLFDKWTNVIRDLEDACAGLGIPVVTPNDLRRTHANWLRDAGVDNASIADVLGHVDSRMVERVYGKLRPEQLKNRVLAAVEGDEC